MSEFITRQSAVTNYITYCGLQTMLNYGLGVEAPEHPKAVALFVGSQTHLAIANAYRHWLEEGTPMALPDLIDMGVEDWNNRTVEEGEQPITDIDWEDSNEGAALTDFIAMLQAYYQHMLSTPVEWVEQPMVYESKEIPAKVTTRLDAKTTKGWLLDYKTSRVGRRKDGSEYFWSYTPDNVWQKAQPFIHLLAQGHISPYAYEVIGKGVTALVQRIPVPHSREQVLNWEHHVLTPTLRAMAAGLFPARPGSHCSWCPYAKTDHCGMLKS